MKKVISFFLLAAVLLAGAAPLTAAQNGSRLTPDEANNILEKTVGAWQVKSVAWQPWNSKFAFSEGSASYRYDNNGNVREHLSLVQPDGTVEEVEGLLRYSAQNKRFEFVQVDEAGGITLLMHGKWNPDFNMIVLTPAIAPRHVSSQVTWQYLFFDDGSFRKVVRTPDGKGNTMIAAEFHCQQPNVAKRKQ